MIKNIISSIPKDWNIEHLSTLLIVQPGYAFKSNDYTDNGVRLIKISNVSFKEIVWDDINYLPNEYLMKYSNYSLNQYDIVMAITRPIISGGIKIARLKESDVPALLNQRNCRFLPKKGINVNYYYQFFFSHYFVRKVQMLATGSEQPNISTRDIENIKVFYPPFPEQHAIVAILENVDTILTTTQQLIDRLQTLKKGLMQRFFTQGIGHTEFQESKLGRIPKAWNVKKFSDIAEIIMGQSPPGETYNEDMNGLPFFQGNADFGYRIPIVRMYCSQPKKIAQPNDILISVRAPVGALNIANIECCIGRGLSIIKISNSSFREYIFQYLSYNQREFQRLMQGSTFTAINKSDLVNLKLPVPNNDSEIDAIASILHNLDNNLANERSYVEQLKKIKKGLMQVLLTGQKRVPLSEGV